MFRINHPIIDHVFVFVPIFGFIVRLVLRSIVFSFFEDFDHTLSNEGFFDVDSLVRDFIEGCSTKNLQLET